MKDILVFTFFYSNFAYANRNFDRKKYCEYYPIMLAAVFLFYLLMVLFLCSNSKLLKDPFIRTILGAQSRILLGQNRSFLRTLIVSVNIT
jgi:hypothetical protein